MAKEESSMSLNTPPLFNGSDYDNWKSCMEIFLIAFDHRVWGLVIDGYTLPYKSCSEWTTVKGDAHKFNYRALNVIVSGLSLDEFRGITHLKTVQEAWKLLLATYGGTSVVKMSKLQMYTSQFRTLRMEEDEEISQFHIKFSNQVNAMRSLCEDISEPKWLGKYLGFYLKDLDIRWRLLKKTMILKLSN